MTKQQYESEIASLLQRKQANVKESRELDGELIALRARYENPSLDELVENEGYGEEYVSQTHRLELPLTTWSIKRNEPTEPQGEVRRD